MCCARLVWDMKLPSQQATTQLIRSCGCCFLSLLFVFTDTVLSSPSHPRQWHGRQICCACWYMLSPGVWRLRHCMTACSSVLRSFHEVICRSIIMSTKPFTMNDASSPGVSDDMGRGQSIWSFFWPSIEKNDYININNDDIVDAASPLTPNRWRCLFYSLTSPSNPLPYANATVPNLPSMQWWWQWQGQVQQLHRFKQCPP